MTAFDPQALTTGRAIIQDFRPVTVERPKALLPLVNAPLIDYALEWLAANRVEEVLLCDHLLHSSTVDFLNHQPCSAT